VPNIFTLHFSVKQKRSLERENLFNLSLGGALASLFSFSAACCDLPHIKRQHPIRCIGIASPKVGNEDFRAAFEVSCTEVQLKILSLHDGTRHSLYAP